MMRGALDFLTSNNPNAKLLRQAYIIYVVPMLNPDGVIFGNNRCGLAGVDLNRQWKNPVKALHPTVFALKTLLQEQKAVREVSMYIDLHGHSRKYNIFMYGCEEKKRPNPKVRAFPKFFSLHNVGKKYVSYADCSFHVRKGRDSTARVVVARDIGIPMSYTVEATFCGADSGPLKYCHMNTGHLEEVGVALVDSFIQYSIAEGDVSDANILSSRVTSGPPGLSHVDNQNLRNLSAAGTFSTSTDQDSGSSSSRKKDSKFLGVVTGDEGQAGSGSGAEDLRRDYTSDGGDDVVSDDDDDVGDDEGNSNSNAEDDAASCAQSMRSEVGSAGSGRGLDSARSTSTSSTSSSSRGGGGYALERSAGSFSLRGGVTTAGASGSSSAGGSRSSIGGIAMLSSTGPTRSDTAPLAGGSDEQKRRLLARDDGFNFSDSVSANRMIAGIVLSTTKPTASFSGDSADRFEQFFMLCAPRISFE